jgi:basic membrane protein A
MLNVTRLFLIALVSAALLLAGCGGTKAPVPAETPKNQKLKVALVIPSTIDDLAWSQSIYEVLKKNDQIELAVSERMGKPVDASAAIRQYATQGYDIVIAHGAQYYGILKEIAPEFPKVTFAYGTGAQNGPNIFAYEPQAQEGAYLLGLMAGKMSKSKTIGIVGPVEAGDAIKYNRGFQQGVAAANADVKVRIAYTGSFGDLVKAGEIAKTHMDAGADILTGSSQQVPGAIKAVAGKPGTYWLSTDMDQSSIAPEAVLAAQTYNWEKIVAKIIDLRKKGTLGGQTMTLSFTDGTLELKYNSKLADKIPQDVKDAVEKAKKDIASGALKIDVSK